MSEMLLALAPFGDPALRLLLVVLACGIIGWEREVSGHSAGLRTNVMVGLGAALFTMLSAEMLKNSACDPTRVISGIAQGIGFLGAGMVFREEHKVRGLTTAATIWVMGGLGIAWGSGAYAIGVVGTLFSLLVLHLLKRLEPALRAGEKNT